MSKWKEITIVALVVLLGVGFKMWLEGHDQTIRAQAEIQKQQGLIQQKDQDLFQKDADRQEILVQERQQLQTLAAAQEKILSASPQQQMQALGDAVQQPLELKTDTDTGKQDLVLPDAPGAMPSLLKMVYKCRECQASLSAEQLEVANLEGQINDWKDKAAALETQRDAAVKIHKTTFWNRAKWFVVGAGAGAVTYVAVHH
jgi:hypothetical protein